MTEAAPLHVVAAVLTDLQGRVLLAQRPQGKAHAGLWEFPGGKVEPGETAEAALARELREELGIAVDAAEPLIRVPVARRDPPTAPPHFRLDTWRVTRFEGDPQAHEHAALAWVERAALGGFPMPPADRPVVAALTRPDRLLIAPVPDEPPEAEAAFLQAMAALLVSGLRRVHLRLPDAREAQRRRLALALRRPCAAAGAALSLHGDPALAAELGLGLHLRAGQLASPEAGAWCAAHRRAGLPLSASCHDAAELRRAEALGVDDVLVGPVRPTPTHPGASGLGWDGFERLRAQVSLPVYALGGVGAADLAEARRHGAQGVAGIRAFWPG